MDQIVHTLQRPTAGTGFWGPVQLLREWLDRGVRAALQALNCVSGQKRNLWRASLLPRGILCASLSALLCGPVMSQEQSGRPAWDSRFGSSSSGSVVSGDPVRSAVTHSTMRVLAAPASPAEEFRNQLPSSESLRAGEAWGGTLRTADGANPLKEVPSREASIAAEAEGQESPQAAIQKASLTSQSVLERDADSSVAVKESGAAPFLDLTGDSQADALASSGAANRQATAPFSGEQFVTILIWLLILFCTMILCVLGLRKWQRTRGLLPVASGQSRVLQTLSLGPGRTVSLIEMNGLRALVGADAGGIRTIVLAPQAFDDSLSSAVDMDGSTTLLEA